MADSNSGPSRGPGDSAEGGPKSTETRQARGNAYWIRHGESDSNETRIYAGVVDSRLTPIGVLQGKNAGLDMKKKLVDRGIVIDAVYTSYQSRALETYREALSACGGSAALLRNPDVSPELRVDIAERNFGVMTKGNYSMLMRVLGYNRYQSILHSRDESPLGGEGMQSIYLRCRKFYETVVEPRLDRGENILIVCHSYVLMAMAYAVAKQDLSNFRFFKVPNGQVLDNAALVAEMDRETSGFKRKLTVASDYASMYTLKVSVVSFFCAFLIKVVSPEFEIDTTLFQILIVLLLGVGTFYVYLDVNLAIVFRKTSWVSWTVFTGAALVRWAVSMVLVTVDSDAFGLHVVNVTNSTTPEEADTQMDIALFRYLVAHFCVFLLVPPALTTVTLSQSLGGYLYPTAAISTVFSVLMPVAMMIVASSFSDATEFLSLGDMPFFFVILAVAYLLPIALSQVWGRMRPIQSKKHVQHWNIVASASYVAMAFLVGLAFTPSSFIFDVSTVVLFDFFNDTAFARYDNLGLATVSNDFVAASVLLPLCLAIFTNIFVHVTGAVSSCLARRCGSETTSAMERLDIYLLVTSPNLFLWMSVQFVLDQATEPETLPLRRKLIQQYIYFWTSAVFFCLPAIVESVLVSRFARGLINQSLGKARMTTSDVNKLWKEVLERVSAIRKTVPTATEGFSKEESRCENYANSGVDRANSGGPSLNVFRRRRFVVAGKGIRSPQSRAVSVAMIGASTSEEDSATKSSTVDVPYSQVVTFVCLAALCWRDSTFMCCGRRGCSKSTSTVSWISFISG